MINQRNTGRRAGHIVALPLILSIALPLLLCACAGKREQIESAPTPQPAAPQATQQTQAASTATPNAPAAPSPASLPPTAEVTDKLARIFKGAAQIDATLKDNVFVGDFNGDGS